MSYEDPDPYGRRRPLEYRSPDPSSQRSVWRALFTILGVTILVIFLLVGVLFGACMLMARR
jgi:hypothetical protein